MARGHTGEGASVQDARLRSKSASVTPATINGINRFKMKSVRRWSEKRLGTLRHELRVARLASSLFELTRPFHELTSEHHRLLRLASILHDVGRCRGERNHARRGAAMLLRDRHLPLTPPERRILAYLTRYHRGPVPSVGDDGILIRGDGRAHAWRLLALLRVADALDCRSLPAPGVTFQLRADVLRTTCVLPDGVSTDRARDAFDKRKKFKLAERALGLRVSVKIKRPVEEKLSDSGAAIR